MRFSILRLITGTTIVAFLLAFASAYPALALKISLPVMFFAPVAIALAMAISLSSDHRTTVLIVLFSSLIGWLLSPQTHIYWTDSVTSLDRYMVSLRNEGVWITGGSLVGFILSCFWSSRLEHKRHRN